MKSLIGGSRLGIRPEQGRMVREVTGKWTWLIRAVQRALAAYRGDKMSHIPLTLVRAAPGKPWVRFDGFARADDLMAERRLWTAAPVSLVAS